ncbi:MAG: AAA family ATPase, partial [Polyangiaceae bacterium]|nr:AAA family ATPase [Polyangiaceae bacterium]
MSIPGYRLEERIHTGAGTDVHRAIRLTDGAPIILKSLSQPYPTSERIAWLRQEYETLRSLDVEGVVKACALETSGNHWAIAMEDIGGASLDRLSPPFGQDVEAIGAVAVLLVDALDAVHRRGIVHNAVCPANVVWSEAAGRVQLIDFGSASAISRERVLFDGHRVADEMLPYASPEQTGRMNRAVDYRTDFYSLGATLYELLTGRPPFVAADPMALVHCHIARHPTPPDRIAPHVPRLMSEIVMKLMAKTAEARYQSATGIKADLEASLGYLRDGRTVVDVMLGAHDIVEQFRIPQRLYGREAEIAALLAAFERVGGEPGSARARAELMLVSGSSGTGKSVLVQELYVPITERRGYFCTGKFDQLQQSTPYSALVGAFRSLVRQLLGAPAAEVASWRARILGALQGNAQVIVDVIPELLVLIGPQPRVPELGAAEAQNRFHLAFQGFIQVIAQRQHPLVLFLDDLQWADSASLRLIDLVLADDRPQCLFVIGAYRDNEVGPAHPLEMTLGALRAAGVPIHRIHVAPLDAEHVAELVADGVRRSRPEAQPLADLVQRTTEGNPLFISQLLKAMHGEGLLVFDHGVRGFRWDLSQIEARGIPDDLVDFVVGKLRRLPEGTQQALRLSACIGNAFDLPTLSVIHELPLAATAERLAPAIQDGFVLPLSEPEIMGDAPRLFIRSYRFLHDRVQQAAYALIDEEERRAVHLRIGRLMLASATEHDRAERIFDLVGHLNVGRDLVTDPAERRAVAVLNAEAAKKARASTAYAAARDHLRTALDLLSEAGWDAEGDLLFAVCAELVEVEHLSGDPERAERIAAVALERARTPLERLEIHSRLLNQYTLLARYGDVLQTARAALAGLGVRLPEGDQMAAARDEEFLEARRGLAARDLDALAEAPEMADPEARAICRLLAGASSSAFYLDRGFFVWIVARLVNLSLRHGPSPESGAFGYFAHVLGSFQSDYRFAREVARLALRYTDRIDSVADRCRTSFIVANFAMPWLEHLRDTLPINNSGYQAGLRAGDLQMAGYILVYKLQHAFYEGKPLAEVRADLSEFLQFLQKTKNRIAADVVQELDLALANLSGDTASALDFDVDGVREVDLMAACEASHSVMAICFFHIHKAYALYVHGEPAAALASLEVARPLLPAIIGSMSTSYHHLLTSLCAAALHPVAPADERPRLLERLSASQAELARWEETCPANFAPMRALVAAEAARIADRPHEAMDLYEEAIASARRGGFLHIEALADELCSAALLARGKPRQARAFLEDARFAYDLWGAKRKVRDLDGVRDRSLASLGRALDTQWLAARPEPSQPAAAPDPWRRTGALDPISVVQACQAISGELVLERLLDKLMGIVIENAGSQRGVLLLESKGDLAIRVDARVDADERGGAPQVSLATPESAVIPESIIHYVARTREIVLLHDAAHEGQFIRDPYVARERPQSVLCAPLVDRRELVGILYLENNLTTGAFTPDRLETLRLLSYQIVISITSARLYNDMEQLVEARTEELRRRNAELQEALRSLRDTQTKLISAEKLASLGQLTAGIAHELKNPLNFINNFAVLNVELVAELESSTSTGAPPLQDCLIDLKENMERILHHGRRADGIIRSMMQHASGGVGEREVTEVNPFVERYLKLAAHGAVEPEDPSIRIDQHFGEGVGSVEMIPKEMGRVVINLLNNAVHAVRQKRRTSAGGYTGTIRVTTRRAADQVQIRVEDDGPGIPAAIRGRIFEPFFT